MRSWRAWAGLIAQGLVLLLYSCTCVFALHLVPIQAGTLCAHALAHVRGERPRVATHGVGVLALAPAIATGAVILIAASIGDRSGGAGAPIALVLAGSILVNAAWAPVALAPFALLEGEPGMVAAIVRSFELSARRGLRSTLTDGAIVGAIAGGVVVLSDVLLPIVVPSSKGYARSLSALAWIVLAPAPIAVRLARAYADAQARAAFDRARDPRVMAGVRTLAWLVAPAGGAVALSLAIAALVPSPMERGGTGDVPTTGAWQSDPRRVEIPGAHGLVVTASDRGVSLETADGGGAGLVSCPCDRRRSEGVLQVAPTGEREWIAVLDGTWSVRFDDEGVRTDDGIARRVGARLSRHALAALVIALALAVALAAILSRSLSDARALDAPLWSRASPPAAGALVRIEGRLRLAEGARIALARGHAHVEGAAHVEVPGDVLIALPPTIPLLALHEARLDHGAPVTLVAPESALRALGPRQGSTPLPSGARIVPEDRDHAAERVVTRAARSASLLAVAIAAALGLAALSILLTI